MANLPTGTVTFLFTDIEGSTRLLQRLGDRRYAEVLEEHRRLLRAAFEEEHGQEVSKHGDAFLVAFSRATEAVGAAVAAQRSLAAHPWPDGASLRVRMGLHTGEAVSAAGDYAGLDVHRASRICSVGHGGQILLSQAVADLARPFLPPGVHLRDLGNHRLKDVREPEHLLQVLHPDLQADFPPLRTLDARPNNLPIQLTSFIGREREMAEVKRLLSVSRLVTLTGSGGAGKTRLALQVAAEILDGYPDGVWLAEFAPITDPALVPKTVASAMSVPEQPGRDIANTLVEALRPRTVLLVLDNCEHLLAACRNLAATLLRSCPQVHILATSREGLGVPGETLWRVPSLSGPADLGRLPPPEELVLYDAVRLFADRAIAGVPGFTLTSKNASTVVQVCRRLDGIPLAIELAAARMTVLTAEQVAARLDDRFRLLTGGSPAVLPRHQTLGAAIDWSYDLLTEPERAMLRRLSVFAGGCTLEAAEAVCAGGIVRTEAVLDLLTSLVGKSLLVADTRHTDARYQLLETVRQYGLSRLLDSGEAEEVRRRHRDWFVALAEEAWPVYFGPRAPSLAQQLEAEHDNLRAAVEWNRVQKDGAEAGLRLAGGLWWFLVKRSHWSEAREWLDGALSRSAEAPAAVLPRALAGAALLARNRGDLALAAKLATSGLAISRELGDREGAVNNLFHLGIVATAQGEAERATALYEEGLEISQEIGTTWFSGLVLGGLGSAAALLGDRKRAMALHTESLAAFRRTGDMWGIAYALANIATEACDSQDYGWAFASIVESLTICKELGDRWLGAACLEEMAEVASAHKQNERAVRFLGAAEALRETLGWRPSPVAQADHDKLAASICAALGNATFETAWAEGRAMTLEHAIEYALAEETT